MPLRPVYRPIVRKNERQGSAIFDVLACNHSVLVDDSARTNTYRRARACPECAAFVARFVAETAAKDTPVAAAPAPAAPVPAALVAKAKRAPRSKLRKRALPAPRKTARKAR